MMSRWRRRSLSTGEVAEINIVPLVDVLLVLLVIFMITAPVVANSLQVQLPQADIPAGSGKGQSLVVSINQAGEVALNRETLGVFNQAATRQSFRSRVRLWRLDNPGSPALLRADARLSYGRVLQVMAELRRLQVKQVGLVIEQP